MADDLAHATDGFFLSYSRSDERFALRLAKDVRARGVAIWVDQFDIRPSEHWDRAIERAVRECRGIVVVLSPRSVASDNVADEISFAIDSGKSVLPVMIERCTLPLRISRMQLIDATGNYERALEQCLSELKRPRAEAPGQRKISQASSPPDAATIAAMKVRLAPILGPIAGIVVDKAALRATSAKELYSIVAQHIDKEADRQRFLDGAADQAPSDVTAVAIAPVSSEPLIPVADLAPIAAALAHHLGPIASIVAKKEARTCASLEELTDRLAEKLPKEEDRVEFRRRLAARA